MQAFLFCECKGIAFSDINKIKMIFSCYSIIYQLFLEKFTR